MNQYVFGSFCILFIIVMVNDCVCGGCTNFSLSGHRVQRFTNKKNYAAIFCAGVCFVQVKRRDFTSASASKKRVHYRPKDYHPGDMMEFNIVILL